jgi:hypothetical protein
MTPDLALRILILAAGIFLVIVTAKDKPDTQDDKIDRNLTLGLSIIIAISGVIGLLKYII